MTSLTKHIPILLLLTTLSAPTWAQRHSSVLELDGRREYLQIPAHRDFDISPEGSYTISLHLSGDRTIIYNTGQRLISRRDLSAPKGSDQSGYELLGLRNLTTGFFGISTPDQAGGYDHSLNLWTGEETNRRELYRWYHVAWVVDRATQRMRLYIDAPNAGLRQGYTAVVHGQWSTDTNRCCAAGR